jgi:ring-1,2-phenylacetyl-CoA epoxidase subunit PaaD
VGAVAGTNAPAGADARIARAWDVLRQVPDPEVPAISVCDLGIVRDVVVHDDVPGLEVIVTPTYSGCPATEVISQDIASAVNAAGLGPARITMRRAPAWTTDWITPEGRTKLRDYGIAPPDACGSGTAAADGVSPIRVMARNVPCPRCGSAQTERLSAFGSTACKALYRCIACREPFEHFKPI